VFFEATAGGQFLVRQAVNISANAVDVIFFAVMILLFPFAAKRFHNRAYIEYRKNFLL
jgi:hypothetical protein